MYMGDFDFEGDVPEDNWEDTAGGHSNNHVNGSDSEENSVGNRGEEREDGDSGEENNDSEDGEAETEPFYNYHDWDNGELLTPEERALVLKIPNNYKRARAMNIHRREHKMVELELITEVGPIVPPGYGPPPAHAKLKPKSRKTMNRSRKVTHSANPTVRHNT